MPAHRTARWTSAEIALLREHYPNGLAAAQAALPHRAWRSIYLKASRLKVRVLEPQQSGRSPVLAGENLKEALRLRAEGWSLARIGAHFNICETAASNAILAVEGKREGHRPATRTSNGRLTEESVERLRLMLRKGFKAVDIQRRLGLSAASVSHHRRLYNEELRERGKALLPPPGGGQSYSGVRVSKEKVKEAEGLFLEGYGTAKVSAKSGVSKTVCTRIRNRLIARLKRKGETLPGCDASGKRIAVKGSVKAIPAETVARFRAMLLDRVPVRRAALECGLGTCAGYRERDKLNAELGGTLPKPKLPGKTRPLQRQAMRERAIPREHFWRFRELVAEHGDAEARRLLKAEIAEARRNLPFEERVKLISDPSVIVKAFKPTKAAPDGTMGGVASLAAAEAA